MVSTVREEALKLRTNIDNVYDAGRKAEYDSFWDALQQNGTRTDYQQTFSGYTWNADMFYPKYDIRAVKAYNMFYAWSSCVKQDPFDLAARLEECGVVLDTSEAISVQGIFGYSGPITRLPVLDFRKATNTTGAIAYAYSRLTTIDKIIVSETTPFTDWFVNCSGLANVTFEGVIGQSLDAHWCPLTKASLISIVSCLKNYVDTDKAYAYTLTLSQNCIDMLNATPVSELDLPDDYQGPGYMLDYVGFIGWNLQTA